MTATVLKSLIPLIVAGHGLLHVNGIIATITSLKTTWALDVPWVLTADITLRSPVGRLFGVLWAAALIALVAGAYGLYSHAGWYRPTLLAGAALSAVAVLPWLAAIPSDQWFWVLAFDAVIAVGLLLGLEARLA